MSVTAYSVVHGRTMDELVANVTTAIGLGLQPYGPPTQNPHASYPNEFSQVMVDGTPQVVATAADIGDITGLQAALDALTAAVALKADTTALTSGLAAKADLSGGKVPVAQLPVATNAAKGIASFSTGTTVAAGVVTVP